MNGRLAQITRGEGLVVRALRSSLITGTGFVARQAVRLASNLILTRLLFPEAFGMMALVTVFLTGLVMFSDLGIGPSIMSSARGDEEDFLNTAWTVQILRAIILFFLALALAWPVSLYYGEPDLLHYLPVAALTLIISGLNPTRMDSANRHLRAGRLTMIELGSQVVQVITGILLAWAMGSIWALVIASLVGPLGFLIGLNLFLAGPRNRLRWERAAAQEIIHFGKWIFLSTFMGFVISQADKVVLGRTLDLGTFGIYNVAWFIASFPMLMGSVVMSRVLIPVYRQSPPAVSHENFQRVRRMRAFAVGVLLAMVAVLAFTGNWLVGLLYDARYHMAGAMVVLIAAAQIPAIVIMTCDQAALAAGDSRRYFVFSALRAVTSTTGIIGGWTVAGLPGAVIGQALGDLLAWPVLAWLLRPHRAFDWKLDLGFLAAGAAMAALAIALNAAPIAEIFVSGGG